MTLLASQAAVAIENARLYESATRWSRQLETLHEVVRSIVDETEVERLLQLVCDRIRELTDARIAFAALGSGRTTTSASSPRAATTPGELVGHVPDRDGTKVGRVLERRQTSARRLVARRSGRRTRTKRGRWVRVPGSTSRWSRATARSA